MYNIIQTFRIYTGHYRSSTLLWLAWHGSIICVSDGAKVTESTIDTIIVIFAIPCIFKDDVW